MPKITNNNGDLSKAFVGNAEVEKIYLGNTELYSKAAPVGYVIPAGTYYGKDVPELWSIELSFDIAISFDSNNTSYDTLSIMVTNRPIRVYISYDNNEVYNYLDLWDSNNQSITVTTDTTVTQDEYNAFFACFDYAFTVNGNEYGYQPQNITWGEYIASSYNAGEFSYNSQNHVTYNGGEVYLDAQHRFSVMVNDTIDNGYYYFSGGGD